MAVTATAVTTAHRAEMVAELGLSVLAVWLCRKERARKIRVGCWLLRCPECESEELRAYS